MKKSDFISILSETLQDYNEMDVRLSANLIQKVIIDSLKKRNRVEIRGFGTFCIRDRKETINCKRIWKNQIDIHVSKPNDDIKSNS